MALKAFCPVSHPAVQSGFPLPKILTPSLQAHSLERKPYLSAPTYFSLTYSPGVLFSQFPLPVTLESCCSWFLAQLFCARNPNFLPDSYSGASLRFACVD